MKRQTIRKTVTFAALIGAAMLTAHAAGAAPQTLKFSTMESPNGPLAKCFMFPVLDELQKASNGKVTIDKYMGGTAFSNPLLQYQQVAQGVMDISQGVLSYTPGQFALTEVATMPFLVDDATAAAIAINRLAPTYLANDFKDIHLLAVLVTPPLYVHVRGDETSLFALKDKRIRATGVGATNLFKKIGITPVAMPAPAVYENLQKGVIDGAIAEFTALHEFRIGEVTKTHILANVSSALLFLGMSKQAYAGLPADLRKLIDTRFSGPQMAARAAACWEHSGASVVTELKKEGQTIAPFSDADRAKVMPIAKQVTDDYIAGLEAKGKKARAFYDALIAEIAKVKAERGKSAKQ
ncbi:MAG TPA: TRAP transporter substrate-binding protein DctP [Pseudolabrys sp.]|nr:TRAP transporter substrate-binding protein DctP [Pseudolabrys sp.]